MNKLNGKRIILGGLLSGVVLLTGEVVTEPLLGGVHERWLADLGLPVPGEAAMSALVALSFLVGVVLVWLYAVLRTSYGPGARTAVRAGLVVWILDCIVPNVAMTAFGVLSIQLFLISSLHALVVVPLAALAGARIYRDPEAKGEGSLAPVAAGASAG